MFFRSTALEDILGFVMKTIGIEHGEASESHMIFLERLFEILRDDFRIGLKQWNIADF